MENSKFEILFDGERWQEHVAQIALRVCKMRASGRRKLLAGIRSRLNDPRIVGVEATRIRLVKVLIALLPDSAAMIRSIMQYDTGRQVDEVRFSLFCFLDEIVDLSLPRDAVSEMATIIGEYLRTARSNRGHAAWMAGDLLGDHWDPVEGAPILMDVLANGAYVAGRMAALHGLEHTMVNVKRPRRLRKSVREAIHSASRGDRSNRIRQAASCIMDGKGACSANDFE